MFSDFFKALDDDCGRLTLQSSVPEIVRYFREGIQRLKEQAAAAAATATATATANSS